MQEQERNKYRELSRKEKDKKKEYGRNRYQNMSEKGKQRMKKYQKATIVKQKNHIYVYIYMTFLLYDSCFLIIKDHLFHVIYKL